MNGSDYYIESGISTVPKHIVKTGTITTVGKAVKGTGTLFLTEARQEDYVFKIATEEIQKIASIESNTLMWLYAPFTADIAVGTGFLLTPYSDFREVGIDNPAAIGGAIGKVNGANFAGQTKKVWQANDSHYVEPLTLNGTTAPLEVHTLK